MNTGWLYCRRNAANGKHCIGQTMRQTGVLAVGQAARSLYKQAGGYRWEFVNV